MKLMIQLNAVETQSINAIFEMTFEQKKKSKKKKNQNNFRKVCRVFCILRIFVSTNQIFFKT